MSVNNDLLQILINSFDSSTSAFTLHLNENSFSLSDVSVIHSSTSVTEPTTRGGVYFSDKFAYKMKGMIKDLSVVPLLTKMMLGPNTEFGDLKITTQINSDNVQTNLEIFTNLINSVQTPNSIELSMIIVRLESV